MSLFFPLFDIWWLIFVHTTCLILINSNYRSKRQNSMGALQAWALRTFPFIALLADEIKFDKFLVYVHDARFECITLGGNGDCHGLPDGNRLETV